MSYNIDLKILLPKKLIIPLLSRIRSIFFYVNPRIIITGRGMREKASPSKDSDP